MPHAPQPDAKTRCLVPALSLGLTALLCCAETTAVRPEYGTGRFDKKSTRPPRVDPTTPPASPTTDVAPTVVVPVPVVEPVEVGPPAIRVRLERVRGRLPFGISGQYRIVNGAAEDASGEGSLTVATGSNLASAFAEARNGTVRINGFDLGRPEVTIVPESAEALSVGKRRYAGSLILRASGEEISALNLVELEDYVVGVLYAEMPDRFANEALRAQAVISRSFALYHAQLGHELRDDQGSQMYVGLERADASARRIVDSTLGEVLTWNGIPIEAYFHSTCGGKTASARAVFGIQVPPPLDQSVACGLCSNAPNFAWTRKITRADLDKLYRGALGANLRVQPSERDGAGRALRVDLLNGDGKVVDRAVADRFRNDYNAGRSLSKQLLSTWWSSVNVDKKTLNITGRGFGHGVGLCQYGAGGYAGQGKSYRDILGHYFPGADLTRLYDL